MPVTPVPPTTHPTHLAASLRKLARAALTPRVRVRAALPVCAALARCVSPT